MIIIESKELESFALDGDGMIAVPISVEQEGSDIRVTAYRRFLGMAEEFVRLHSLDPLSAKAERMVTEELKQAMSSYGYVYDPKPSRVVCSYELSGSVPMHSSEVAELLPAKMTDGLRSLLTFYPEVDPDDPADRCAAVIIDGVIVSAAQVNDLSADGVPELNVETASGYRGRGFASSCVRVLSAELLKHAERLLYRCYRRNRKSAAVAEASGFACRSIGRSFVYYR